VLQLAIGIPLEMVHKWWRVMLVYLLGSLMGCLAHSVTDFPTYLLGASGGVYALIGAHAANVIVNWKEMRFGVVRSIVLGLYILFDFGWALYQRYGKSTITNVSLYPKLGLKMYYQQK
jgi:rhomboid-related protein 1/2/3